MSERTVLVPGSVVTLAALQRGSARVQVEQADEATVRLATSGFVVSLCGGGNAEPGSEPYAQAGELAHLVVQAGGMVVNGGENAGVMLASTQAIPDATLGIACPYHVLSPHGAKAIVTSYQTRKMLLTAMPTVVVFPGQVGTLDELVTTIGWMKSLAKQGTAQPPKLFVHRFWVDVLELLGRKGAVQRSVLDGITVFSKPHEVVS